MFFPASYFPYIREVKIINKKNTLRYQKDKGDVIKIYRNKRKPIRQVKAMYKNEDGCIVCSLFDVCLVWGESKNAGLCEEMEKAGVIEPNLTGDRFFVNVPFKN